MTTKPALNVRIVKPGEKEQALRDFIASHIDLQDKSGEPRRVVEATLIALSPASPAARALAGAADAWAGATVRIRAIFASLETPANSETSLFGTAAMAASVRQLTDIRLNDAHEQMVLDGAATWVGDCLRRDPLRRDAFETFAVGPAATATRWATLSFERLWTHAVPVGCDEATTSDVERHPLMPVPDQGPAIAASPVEISPTALVSTRH